MKRDTTTSFFELLGDISSRLHKVDARTIDQEIRRAVAAVGKYYRLDRVDLRRFTEDRSGTTLLHGWVSGDNIGVSLNLQNVEVPWASSLILTGRVARIRSLADLPPEAAGGRVLMEKDGLEAALLVPLTVNDRGFGALVIASRQKRDWRDETVDQIRTLGETIAYAFENAQLVNRLWTSEVRLQALLEVQSEFVVNWLPDGTQTWANDAHCRYVQQAREKLIGTNFLTLFPRTAREDILDWIQNLSPGGPRQSQEVEVTNPAGEITWQRWKSKGIFDANGALLELQSIGHDVSDTARARHAVRQRTKFERELSNLSMRLSTAPIEETKERSETEFRRICSHYDLHSAAIWTFSEDETDLSERRAGWRIEKLDQIAPKTRMHGIEVPWFVQQVFESETIIVDDVDELPKDAQTDRATLQSWGIGSVLAFPVRTSTNLRGSCIFTSMEPRKWDSETVQELRLIANTITSASSRLWAAEDILNSQRDLERSQAVAGVGNFTIELDPPSNELPMDAIVIRSKQGAMMVGAAAQQETVRTGLSRLHKDDADKVEQNINVALKTGKKLVETYRLVRHDGSIIHVEGRIEFDCDENGLVKRIFGIILDITERIREQRKLERALAEIEKLRDQLQQENLFLRDEIRVAHGFEKIIGSSTKLRRTLALAEKVAPTGVPALILGETGTGKELIAQAIHDLSDRKNHVMISVNCAALSRDLIESELFGHEKGAFTGAHDRRKGRFELADGGTLFLDEIGDLPGDLQAKLLRVLQTGDFERLGGTQTLHSDVRIVAATNKNLRRAVDEGEFRADLYYRIGSYPIELPPLRDRREDIPELIEFLVQKHAERMGKNIESISARTIRNLTAADWPGNVRELEGVLQRALISTTGPILDNVELPTAASKSLTTSTSDLKEAQRRHISQVLEESRWVIDGKNGAAARLGVAASTLRSKMKRLGISRPD